MLREIRLFDNRFGPHAAQQFILGDNLATSLNQKHQEIESPRANRHTLAVVS